MRPFTTTCRRLSSRPYRNSSDSSSNRRKRRLTCSSSIASSAPRRTKLAATRTLPELEEPIVCHGGELAPAAAFHPRRDQRTVVVFVGALVADHVRGARHAQHVARFLAAIRQARKAYRHRLVREGKEPRESIDHRSAGKSRQERVTNLRRDVAEREFSEDRAGRQSANRAADRA